MKGVIVRYIDARGFGFIDEGSGDNLFFHINEMDDPNVQYVTEGQAVTFEVKHTAKGRAATQIKLVK